MFDLYSIKRILFSGTKDLISWILLMHIIMIGPPLLASIIYPPAVQLLIPICLIISACTMLTGALINEYPWEVATNIVTAIKQSDERSHIQTPSDESPQKQNQT